MWSCNAIEGRANVPSQLNWIPSPPLISPIVLCSPLLCSARQFVYPYSLETHVLQPQPPHISHAERLAVQAEQHAKRVEFLKRREAEKARRKREQLRKVAPGWEPPEEDGDGGDPSSGASADPSSTRRQSGILEPTRKHTTMRTSSVTVLERPPSQPSSQQPRDVMDDLVEGLAKLDQLRVDDAGGA